MQTTTVSGGEITDDGGSIVIAGDGCWNTDQNSTFLDFQTADGQGTNNWFTSVLTEFSAEKIILREHVLQMARALLMRIMIITLLSMIF